MTGINHRSLSTFISEQVWIDTVSFLRSRFAFNVLPKGGCIRIEKSLFQCHAIHTALKFAANTSQVFFFFLFYSRFRAEASAQTSHIVLKILPLQGELF